MSNSANFHYELQQNPYSQAVQRLDADWHHLKYFLKSDRELYQGLSPSGSSQIIINILIDLQVHKDLLPADS